MPAETIFQLCFEKQNGKKLYARLIFHSSVPQQLGKLL